MSSILLKGGTIIGPKGRTRADILQVDGVITKIGEIEEPADTVTDASSYLIFPGLIDCHVHFREPGFEHKATIATESASARAGGITCVCEMPNTNPPTVTISALGDKIQRAALTQDCDVRFFFGVTKEPHLMALKELWTSQSGELQTLKKGCSGVKLFLDHSTGNQMVDAELAEEVFAACGELGIPLVAHCEDPKQNTMAKEANHETGVEAHSKIRPARSEAASIAYAIDLARKHGAQFHVAHLSTAQGLEHVKAAKAEGLPITCEVAPHHLIFSERDYEKLGTLVKMNPPVRTLEDNEALWRGIEQGDVDCIATDHAPHTPEEKSAWEGDDSLTALDAPSGVPGVETTLPLVLKRLKPEDIYRTMYTNPNRIYSLGKEDIAEGSGADIVLFDPTHQWTITAKELHSKCGWTPYEGMQVKGKVVDVL